MLFHALLTRRCLDAILPLIKLIQGLELTTSRTLLEREAIHINHGGFLAMPASILTRFRSSALDNDSFSDLSPTLTLVVIFTFIFSATRTTSPCRKIIPATKELTERLIFTTSRALLERLPILAIPLSHLSVNGCVFPNSRQYKVVQIIVLLISINVMDDQPW